MKTKEELNAIKKEVENINKKLAELNEDELKEVTGGIIYELSGSGMDVEGSEGTVVGDICGKNDGSIEDCSNSGSVRNTGSVSGTEYVGGLVGAAVGATNQKRRQR